MATQSAYILLQDGNYWKDSAIVTQLKIMIALNAHSKTTIYGTWVVKISFGHRRLHKEITHLFWDEDRICLILL